MKEDEFWSNLEWRLCSEFYGMADRHYQYLWCDGIYPIQYSLEAEPAQIIGRAWICNGAKQELWDFTLFLPGPTASVDAIDWKSLIPAADRTCWIAVDRDRMRIEIEPAAAVPDLA
ncbi:MAG TPA: hypothetical protein VHR72_15205 [Gemmataceae bacterium]|jgi:hypothetical protein|nr:hypothetical protein [Gemmataceae bacterium]